MRVGIVTIQKNRAPWIPEWLAFHRLAGFDTFYFFAHNCTDNTMEVLGALSSHYDIRIFKVDANQNGIQLAAYQHALINHGHECDWFAFIDGDEFLLPTQAASIGDALAPFNYQKISGIGVYWSCFGSSQHEKEPSGLVTKNYKYRFLPDNPANRHIKSIIRGRQNSSAGPNAHIFNTPHGIFDENMRPITSGLTDYFPTYDQFQINHYVTQSREFFKKFKQRSGAADAGATYVRPDSWWDTYDMNDVFDQSMEKWDAPLEAEIQRVGFCEINGQWGLVRR